MNSRKDGFENPKAFALRLYAELHTASQTYYVIASAELDSEDSAGVQSLVQNARAGYPKYSIANSLRLERRKKAGVVGNGTTSIGGQTLTKSTDTYLGRIVGFATRNTCTLLSIYAWSKTFRNCCLCASFSQWVAVNHSIAAMLLASNCLPRYVALLGEVC